MKEKLLKEARNISEQINNITNQYKDCATKLEMEEFKNIVANSLSDIEGYKHSSYSIIRISTVDRLGTLKEYQKLIQDVLEFKFEKGSVSNFAIYKEKVWVSFHDDIVEFWMMSDMNDDSLMIEVKDKLINILVKEYNARKICLYTKLLDGYQNWEFFDCERYVEPKETRWTRFLKFCEGMNS